MERHHSCLTVAGSDSSGGAGIQADLRTFSDLGRYGTSAITAVTAQNTTGIRSIHFVPPEEISAQIEAVLEDIPPDAIKTGMLGTPAAIGAVGKSLVKYLGDMDNGGSNARSAVPLVVDPVMSASSGANLLNGEFQDALSKLFEMASLVTPNLDEAARLSGLSLETRSEVEKAAEKLLKFGPRAVLVKGGHGQGSTSDDCLATTKESGEIEFRWLNSPRIETANTHGTGCALAAAIAGFLAGGADTFDAVSQAKAFVSRALDAGKDLKLGRGTGPCNSSLRSLLS